jgi:hypothetical protein
MALLVGMGTLGGVIAVTRCFVDTSTPNPTARDLCYRQVAGAVIALGIRTTRNSFCEWHSTGRFGIGIGLLRSRGSCSD